MGHNRKARAEVKREGLIEGTGAIPSRPERRHDTAWWLVAKDGHLRTEMLTVGCGGRRALPVFSGEGEAEMFVWLEGAFDAGWRIRETPTGELISILCGPCAGVSSIALDPSPGMAKTEMIDLVTVPRERFLDRLVAPARRTPLAAAK